MTDCPDDATPQASSATPPQVSTEQSVLFSRIQQRVRDLGMGAPTPEPDRWMISAYTSGLGRGGKHAGPNWASGEPHEQHDEQVEVYLTCYTCQGVSIPSHLPKIAPPSSATLPQASTEVEQ